ncbi:hypothetical protein [Antarctobacter sp.]|uniref:hypothetical protein n=1 Tax=Antarctobacter sp. TaxID=1872577 RepID=UPI003A94070E
MYQPLSETDVHKIHAAALEVLARVGFKPPTETVRNPVLSASPSTEFRPLTIADLYDLARLCDTLPNIQWFARPVVATDIEDWRELDLNTVYAIAKGTRKHLGTSIVLGKHLSEIIAEVARTENLYPELADRDSPDRWKDKGSMDIRDRAARRVQDIIRTHHPDNRTPEADATVRARFPIRLPCSETDRLTSRWST